MKLNSSQLEAFLVTARMLNFTRAAEFLHVTQSALSQRIAKLEDELETTLLIRERAALRLTESGQKLLRYCQTHEALESDLLGSLRKSESGLSGILRIAGFSSINRSLVLPALKDLMRKNPDLSIQLMTKELHEIDRLLKTGEADYILTNQDAHSVDRKSIFLGYEENVLVASSRHPNVEIFLDHDERDPTTKAYFARNKIKFKPERMRYLDDVYGLLDGVRCGYGKAVLPKHLIEKESDLQILDPKRALRVPIYLQFYTQPYYRRVHETFVTTLREEFMDKLKNSNQ